MTVIIFCYIFYFIVSSASTLQFRWLQRKHEGGGEIAFGFWVMLILDVLALSFPFFSPFYITGNPWSLVGLAALCAVFGAGYYVASFVAQKHVEAGITTLALNISTPITILLSTLFISEPLKPLQLVGTALLLTALFLISKKHRIGKFKFDKYFLLMLAGGIMLGVLFVAERALQKITGFSGGTLISWWSQCAGLGLAMLIFKSKNSHSLKETLATGGIRFLQGLAWVVLIYTVANLSVASSIATFKVVIVFIAAAIFLKEREDLPRKIFGSIIAVAGLLLMK